MCVHTRVCVLLYTFNMGKGRIITLEFSKITQKKYKSSYRNFKIMHQEIMDQKVNTVYNLHSPLHLQQNFLLFFFFFFFGRGNGLLYQNCIVRNLTENKPHIPS